MKKKIGIIGAGELGKQIAHLTDQSSDYEVYGFFDDVITVGTSIDKYTVIGTVDELLTAFYSKKFDSIVIGIGYNHLIKKKELYDKFIGQIPFANIIHSTCYIDITAKIGTGVVFYPGCIIDKNVIIKDNVLLNLGVVVSHDSVIASHSFFAPRAAISGFTKIGECCNIGINTTIIDNVNITFNVSTGGGTVVIKSIKQSGLYVGNPARLIRC